MNIAHPITDPYLRLKITCKNKTLYLRRNFEMGGLNMIDIKSYFASLRASWVSRFVSGEMDNWKLTPYKYFRQFGQNWLIFSNALIIIGILDKAV
jgi:hypothetical protein